jgi:hypothetical protein
MHSAISTWENYCTEQKLLTDKLYLALPGTIPPVGRYQHPLFEHRIKTAMRTVCWIE